AGDDTYFVDNAKDVIVEAVGGGTDSVRASVSFVLKAGVEVEDLYANAGNTGLRLTGNEFANHIHGGAGADTINGKAGADVMTGMGGNDKYYVDNAADVVTEATGGGTDTVYTSVNYALQAGSAIENLRADVTGAQALRLTGNELANHIYGGDGRDFLTGGSG